MDDDDDDEDTVAPPKKVFGRPFVKGVSGNPSGRPKTSNEAREALRSPERMQRFLVKLNDAIESGDVAAMALYAKHVFPIQKEVEHSGKVEGSPAATLTTAQLLSIAKRK